MGEWAARFQKKNIENDFKKLISKHRSIDKLSPSSEEIQKGFLAERKRGMQNNKTDLNYSFLTNPTFSISLLLIRIA
jgi:hypothetical protein